MDLMNYHRFKEIVKVLHYQYHMCTEIVIVFLYVFYSKSSKNVKGVAPTIRYTFHSMFLYGELD